MNNFIFAGESAAAWDTLTSSVLWLVPTWNEFVLISQYSVCSNEAIVRHEHYLVHLFWNPPFCASTVSWCRRCRIHRYVAAPIIHILADKNKLIANGNKLQNNTWPSVLRGCTFHYINKIIQNVSFKGTVSRDILLLVFFSWSSFPKPLIIALGSFQIFSKIRTF